MAIVEIVVGAAAMVTSSAAVATAKYAREIVSTVGENEDRSMDNQELLIGDPDTLDHNLVERVSQLEEEIEA